MVGGRSSNRGSVQLLGCKCSGERACHAMNNGRRNVQMKEQAVRVLVIAERLMIGLR